MIFKKFIKKIIKFISLSFIVIMNKIGIGRYFLEQINKNINNQIKKINHNGIKLNFYVPNRINLYRANTFSQKEPETLQWIDNFKEEKCFWDIGANVGIYSCYAAKKKHCKVYAFEASVFNLEFLTKNIYLNNLNDKIIIFSLPLTNKVKETDFNMSSIDAGSASSTFGEEYKQDGTNLNKIFSYKTLGLSIDKAVEYMELQSPDYIKMDVDGIEHLILSGGSKILSKVEEVLVEVDEKFDKQFQEVKRILEMSGLKLISKNQSRLMQKENSESRLFNQIWKR